MNKIDILTNYIFKEEYSSAQHILEEILKEKIAIIISEKKKEIAKSFWEDKNPSRINNTEAERILKNAGFVVTRSGKHQTVWKHPTDKTKEIFPLPHHSRELSPGLTRKVFSLATEEIVNESMQGFDLKRHRLGTGENRHKEAKVYSSTRGDNHQVHYFSNNKKIEVQHFDDFNDADEDASTYVKQ